MHRPATGRATSQAGVAAAAALGVAAAVVAALVSCAGLPLAGDALHACFEAARA